MEGKTMTFTIYKERRGLSKGVFALTLAATLLLLGYAWDYGHAAKLSQKTFNSPTDAFTDMVTAMKDGDDKELVAIFGPYGKEIFTSEEGMKSGTYVRFLKAYEEKNRVEMMGDKKAILHVGGDDWSWPIPVVKAGKRWHFDSQAGKAEILARRIGRNEVAAVQVCLAYVDAQREYALVHRTDKGVPAYARKFGSDDGKKDGLSWEAKDGEKGSPLGPEVVKACRVGPTGLPRADEPAKPYHGYFYKIVTRQGANASGGAYDYIVDDKMVGGFALVAYPAIYGSTGIMTFIVNQDGVAYQKNLGKNTVKSAEGMDSFDPDSSWTKVD
jgi:hypothetical protein